MKRVKLFSLRDGRILDDICKEGESKMSFRFNTSMRLKKRYHSTLDLSFLKEIIGLKRTISNGNKTILTKDFLYKLNGEQAIITVKEDTDEFDEFQVKIKLEKTNNEIILDSVSEEGLETLGLVETEK